MKTCASCKKESDHLDHPPRRSEWYSRNTKEELLCAECLEPCACKGGFRANCTCDAEYEQDREKRW